MKQSSVAIPLVREPPCDKRGHWIGMAIDKLGEEYTHFLVGPDLQRPSIFHVIGLTPEEAIECIAKPATEGWALELARVLGWRVRMPGEKT